MMTIWIILFFCKVLLFALGTSSKRTAGGIYTILFSWVGGGGGGGRPTKYNCCLFESVVLTMNELWSAFGPWLHVRASMDSISAAAGFGERSHQVLCLFGSGFLLSQAHLNPSMQFDNSWCRQSEKRTLVVGVCWFLWALGVRKTFKTSQMFISYDMSLLSLTSFT